MMSINFRGCVASLLLMVSLPMISLSAWSAAPGATPHQVVEQVTIDLMNVIKTGQQALKTNPDEYYASVSKVLEPSVSFDYIARNVMGPTAEQATDAQKAKFAETFKLGLVKTLAKGMANYSDLKITVVPPKEDISGQKRVEVLQEVAGGDKTNQVSYTMAQDKTGEWKLINVILNGVNLGKSFRDQFAQSLKQNGNNIDAVIAGWNSEPKT